MVPPSALLVEHLSDAQREDIIDLSLRAFKDDTSLSAMTGNKKSLLPALFRSMLNAASLEGTIYIVKDESDCIASVGVWFCPGTKLFGSEKQRERGFTDFFAQLDPEIKDWWTNVYAEKVDKLLNDVLDIKYIDSWYANIIATDPAYQRKGFGSALVKAVQKRAMEEVSIIVLGTTSEENVAWYESLGFTIVGKTMIPASTGDFKGVFLTWSAKDEQTVTTRLKEKYANARCES